MGRGVKLANYKLSDLFIAEEIKLDELEEILTLAGVDLFEYVICFKPYDLDGGGDLIVLNAENHYDIKSRLNIPLVKNLIRKIVNSDAIDYFSQHERETKVEQYLIDSLKENEIKLTDIVWSVDFESKFLMEIDYDNVIYLLQELDSEEKIDEIDINTSYEIYDVYNKLK